MGVILDPEVLGAYRNVNGAMPFLVCHSCKRKGWIIPTPTSMKYPNGDPVCQTVSWVCTKCGYAE